MIRVFIIMALFLGVVQSGAQAQSFFDARSAGMGGTGTAISTGLPAARLNPANLMIFERPQRWTVMAGQAGFVYSAGMTLDHTEDPFDYLHTYLSTSDRAPYPTRGSAENIVSDWFENDSRTSTQNRNMDALVFGISYTSENFGLALTHFMRGFSSFEIGRGHYDTSFLNISDDIAVLDRSLVSSHHLYHEFGAALAWEYDLFSGWLSDLSRIYVGVNPKLIIPVAFANHDIVSVYTDSLTGDSSELFHTTSYSGQTAGELGSFYLSQTGPDRATTASYFNAHDLTSRVGIGGGFDAGITYIIGLDRDVSLVTRNKIPIRNSIRFSLALLDIGFVSYNQNPQRMLGQEVVNVNSNHDNIPVSMEFSGNPSEVFGLLGDQEESSLLDRIESENGDPVRLLLPMRIHGGVGLQLNRLALTAEVQHSVHSWDVVPRGTSVHIGGEIRVFRTLPLRSGLILESGQPLMYTAGAGLDFRNLVFSASTSVLLRNGFETLVPTVTTAGAVHIRF